MEASHPPHQKDIMEFKTDACSSKLVETLIAQTCRPHQPLLESPCTSAMPGQEQACPDQSIYNL